MAANNSLGRMWQGFDTLPGSRKATLVMVALLTMASMLTFVYLTNQEDYRVLFSNLGSEDASNILTKLNERKIPYQLSPSGDIISVPSGKVAEIRLELAAAGLPHGGGVGFEIFDNKSFGATEFEQQLNYRRALQGELARTINSLDEIQQSRVHIVLPKASLFIEQQKKPTASVTVKLKAGRKLKGSQIDGIGHLVASSVEGLNHDDVMIVDSQGNMLSKNRGDSNLARLSSSQTEYQRNIEREIATKIQTMLENVVGQGKAVARVNADLDFRIMEKTEESYDPESPVVRSSQKQVDKASGPPAAAGESADAAGGEKEKTDETVNFEINKTTSKTVMPVGEIKKLSIAVLVDGIYTKNDKGAVEFQERAKKELDSFEELVRKSSGFNAERGDQVTVSSMPFNRIEPETGMADPSWQEMLKTFIPFIRYIVITAGILLFFLFVVRPLIRNISAPAQGIDASQRQRISLNAGSSASLDGRGPQLALSQMGNPAQTEVDLVKQLAGADSKKFAELLRNWLQ